MSDQQFSRASRACFWGCRLEFQGVVHEDQCENGPNGPLIGVSVDGEEIRSGRRDP